MFVLCNDFDVLNPLMMWFLSHTYHIIMYSSVCQTYFYYCGNIIVHGGSMFLDYYTPSMLTSPQTSNKLLNCLAFKRNKSVSP